MEKRHATHPTREALRAALSYDEETGIFRWRERSIYANRIRNNDVAGNRNRAGYIHIGLFGRVYPAHRLAWMYCHGVWTKNVEHKNQDKGDNRIDNLRLGTHQQNMWNKAARSDNLSGYKGVSWHKAQRKFQARIVFGGRRITLGYFASAAEAAAAYNEAAKKHFGEFACLNVIVKDPATVATS